MHSKIIFLSRSLSKISAAGEVCLLATESGNASGTPWRVPVYSNREQSSAASLLPIQRR
jgi:hypothetical protein